LRLVLASANPDKVKEIVAVLSASLPVELVPRPGDVPDVVEDADTLVGNARLKARALVAATGTSAVADDTGLEVDALGGAPGVYSARYAGEDATYADNVTKLLRELGALEDDGHVHCHAPVEEPHGLQLGVTLGEVHLHPRLLN
jgi:XTP/dITP diphosphohydrolase